MTSPYIVHIPEVDSTNAEAMRRALAGERAPFWIVAARQTAGRGRSGRTWQSEAGNLQASLLVELDLPAPKAYQLSLVTGVAARLAICAAMPDAPATLRLKWPNDLLIGQAKTGGILVESSTRPGGRLAAVIGIGINLVSHPGDLDRLATHLGEHGVAPSVDHLMHHLSVAVEHWLGVWSQGLGFPAIREAWLDAAHPIGERMSIKAGAGIIAGTFSGLDPDGALILATGDGQVRSFTYGDVSIGQ